jgi:hypothetical protein
MSERDDYALKIFEATWKLEGAEVELRKATAGQLDFPASSHVAKALLYVVEAQRKLDGEL